jgi:hypothetical protein
MTPAEKAETALNHRLERLQDELRRAKSEMAQRALFQSLLVCLAISDALRDYIKAIGAYAQGRHAELKEQQGRLTTQHADVLQAGNALLERFKARPTDKAIRREIERAQQEMESIQKTLRRGANALQRDIAPALAAVDPLADAIKRFSDADQIAALERVTKLVVAQVQELYRTHPGLPASGMIDAAAWEKTALGQIDAAVEFQEAYARAGNQIVLGIDLMAIAVSPAPPQSAEEALGRANTSIGARLKAVAERLARNVQPGTEPS